MDIQERIFQKLDKVDMSVYKTSQYAIKLVKNTVNIKCPICGSENVHVEAVQTRSADEAATNKFECIDCKHKWSHSWAHLWRDLITFNICIYSHTHI